jgi:uncharacterized membrane protein
MKEYLPLIVAIAITGSGVVTGLLFAFSNFVMRALQDLPAEHGMFAMQRINQTIINPIFLIFFMGTPVLCLIIGVLSALEIGASGHAYFLAGAVVYLLGPFGITMLFNVPLNNKLAEKALSESAEAWPLYRKKWQRWNHIRTYMGILSVLLLALGFAGIPGI